MKKWVALAILLTLAAAVGLAHWRTLRYDSLIEKYSKQYRLDFHLVKALIHEESGFDPKAEGAHGELGLMQIMPAVGREFWDRNGGRGVYDQNRLLDPEHNIEVGCWYLRESFDMYKDSKDPLICGLARYNAGQSRVARWMTASAQKPGADFLDTIDFPGTRDYVIRIITRAKRRSQNHLW